MANMGRGFKEIDVTNFSSQQRAQRYPEGARHHQSTAQWDFEDDALHSDEEDGPPRIAEWRSNLAALSQRENLYFAAYQSRVHVTIPRDLKQILPGNADLVLELPVSESAILVGGYIDDTRPHCVNHLIIGNLGTHEVVLMSCDDGDILAYYTHIIATKLTMMLRGEATIWDTPIMPLFHENVGMTAWGLALHEKSRLIAVSSNLREVTVFIPAITFDEGSSLEQSSTSSFPEVGVDFKSSVDFRRNNIRRVLKLGPEGHNIPSITFAGDADGEARSILAVDIQGTLWILDIWGEEKQQIRGIHSRTESQMGWGVLSIPILAFKQTSTPQESLGMLDIHHAFAAGTLGEEVEAFFDISSSVRYIKDNNSRIHPPSFPQVDPMVSGGSSALVLEEDTNIPPWIDPAIDLEESDGSSPAPPDLTSDEDVDPESWGAIEEHGEAFVLSLLRERQRVAARDNRLGLYTKFMPDHLKKSLASRKRDGMECFRYIVNMPVEVVKTVKSSKDLLGLLEKHVELQSKGGLFEPTIETKTADIDRPVFLLPDKSAIIRTYQFDIELIPPTSSMPKTICKNVVKRGIQPALVGLLRPFERLCFLSSVPELSLIIAGSQAGRAALITLTRPDVSSTSGPVVNFRVDMILPRKQEEDAGLRPNLPLYGLAVAPLQVSNEKAGRRRWRLIMHYYDHTLLSYELSRDEDTDTLLVL